jgi:hypothetical protein
VGPTFFSYLFFCLLPPLGASAPTGDGASAPRRLSPGLTLPHLPRPNGTSPWEATTLSPRRRRRRSLVLPQLHYSGARGDSDSGPWWPSGMRRWQRPTTTPDSSTHCRRATGRRCPRSSRGRSRTGTAPSAARRGALPAPAPAPPRARVQVAAYVAQGFEYVHHHAGSVHSRISPAAIIVSDLDLHVRLVHFGAAELVAPAGRPVESPPTRRRAQRAVAGLVLLLAVAVGPHVGVADNRLADAVAHELMSISSCLGPSPEVSSKFL